MRMCFVSLDLEALPVLCLWLFICFDCYQMDSNFLSLPENLHLWNNMDIVIGNTKFWKYVGSLRWKIFEIRWLFRMTLLMVLYKKVARIIFYWGEGLLILDYVKEQVIFCRTALSGLHWSFVTPVFFSNNFQWIGLWMLSRVRFKCHLCSLGKILII